MKTEPKSSYGKAEKKIYSLVERLFVWTDRALINPSANWLNNWQTRVSIQTRNFWIILVLALCFSAGLYNLYIFISTIIK